MESVLYKNLKDQLLFLKNDLIINVNEKIAKWDIINEAVERRNLLVHNNGVVNRKYLRNVKRLIVDKETKGVKVGDILTVEGEYFKRIYDEILTAGVLLVDTCWRKWVKKDDVAATDSLDITIVKSLVREEWNVAEKLGYYAKHIEIKNIYAKYDLTISYCVALKRQGKISEVSKEIGNINEEELTSLQLAQVSVLKDDKDGFYVHVKKVAEKRGTQTIILY